MKKKSPPKAKPARAPVDAANTARPASRGRKDSSDRTAPAARVVLPPPRGVWVVAAVALTWLAGVLIRLQEVSVARANEMYLTNGHMTLTVTDGFSWAASVLDGLGRVDEPLARLPAWSAQAHTALATLLSRWFVAEEVFVYLPVVVAPLVVLPLVFLGVMYRNLTWGFAAALVHSAGFSYFNRTRAAYFDTDMFSVTVPLLAVTLLIGSVVRRSAVFSFLTAALVAVGPFFYSSMGPVLFSIAAVFVLYVVVLQRREPLAWMTVGALALALLPVSTGLRLGLLGASAIIWVVSARVVAVRAFFDAVMRRGAGVGAVVAVVALVGIAFRSKIDGAWAAAQAYLTREAQAPTQPGDITFIPVFSIVREARNIPFDSLVERYAGSTLVFVIGIAGYIAACIRHRSLVLALPFVGLGAFAQWGGLRFTIYAVPVVAVGLGFVVAAVAAWVARRTPRFPHAVAFVVAAVAVAPVLVPQVRAARALRAEPKVVQAEAQLMDELGRVSNPGDFALTWWDYGYPLSYYARINTLIDGARSGDDAFVASQVLFSTQQRQAAHLSRAAIEQYQVNPGAFAITALFDDARARGITPRAFLEELTSPSFHPPDKTREIYLYLPYRILGIAEVIESFSRSARSPEGQRPAQPTVLSSPLQSGNGVIAFTRSKHRLSLENNTLTDARGSRVPIRAIHVAGTRSDGSYRVDTRDVAEGERLHVVILSDAGLGLVVDQTTVNSTLFQLLVFDRPDPAFFSPTARNRGGAIYRVEL